MVFLKVVYKNLSAAAQWEEQHALEMHVQILTNSIKVSCDMTSCQLEEGVFNSARPLQVSTVFT